MGIDADKNSLSFDRTGRLTSLATFDLIMVRKSNGEKKVIFPKLKPGLMEEYEKVPIKLLFGEDSVAIDDGTRATDYRVSECTFKITGGNYTEATICGDCSKCKGCM
ncbi:hypothetical protein [Methanosarcina sp. DH2]|uniref:hypothetical protein n=1 Tax=Methanosarcina sp. DH2 TaxID=2605639 RepID=UPI001E4843E1|nr:hypothetical protein [Methanosarcina sp. DH2]